MPVRPKHSLNLQVETKTGIKLLELPPVSNRFLPCWLLIACCAPVPLNLVPDYIVVSEAVTLWSSLLESQKLWHCDYSVWNSSDKQRPSLVAIFSTAGLEPCCSCDFPCIFAVPGQQPCACVLLLSYFVVNCGALAWCTFRACLILLEYWHIPPGCWAILILSERFFVNATSI